MSRHFSTEQLARFSEGDLRPRKAAKVSSHLRSCPACTEQLEELNRMPSILASVQFPPIPAQLSTRISMAIAGEAAARVAAEPSAEGARRDLPARARPLRSRWRVPVPPGAGLRTVAAVGAAVIVAGGGYEIATHVGSGSGAPSSTAGAAVPAQAAAPAGLKQGPRLTFRHGGHTHTITSILTDTNFGPDTLGRQTAAAIAAAAVPLGPNAHRLGQGPTNTFGANNGTSAPAGTAGTASAPGSATSAGMLQGCVDKVAAGRTVLLVDVAKYEGLKATVIVVSSKAGGPAFIYVVGAQCSAANSDIIKSQQLNS
jgi:hypothetical protein